MTSKIHNGMGDSRFNLPKGAVSFPQIEKMVLDFWKEERIFEKSLERNIERNIEKTPKEDIAQNVNIPHKKETEKNQKRDTASLQDERVFVFYDGPPFATGLPHFGHFVPNTVKDVIPRYQTMKGRYVERRFGWDCHGLPVEFEAQQELGLKGRDEILSYGIDKFNEYCRSIVLRYATQWRSVIERLGRWVDFDNDYKTMDKSYMESIWWVFGQLYKKGLIYKGYTILPVSPQLGTPLSNFEVNLGGYKDVHDPAITVAFESNTKKRRYYLAWTTTPWTLPSNLGLAVSPTMEYEVLRAKDGREFVLAKDARTRIFEQSPKTLLIQNQFETVASFRGDELEGQEYIPLFDYFSHIRKDGAFKIHCGSFVNADEGTGIVHMAPGFGEDDYQLLAIEKKVPIVCPVTDDCIFTAEVKDYEGLFVKDADKPIIADLKHAGVLIKSEQYLHSYPHCYRTKKALIYKAVSSWFVDVECIKQNMIDANKTIRWIPAHIKDGRFGKWLENARAWAISRNRFWGNPIPVWMSEDGSKMEVISSVAELEEKTGCVVKDLHKHYVDELTWKAEDGSTMRRVPEVLDCWFESGAMPFAQNHYPFENKAYFERNYPGDFISESLDQTRGWFYTLTVLSAGLFNSVAFNNVIVSGLVLSADGKKMSKSERNYTAPTDVIAKYGADAIRLLLMSSSILKAEDLKYHEDGVRDEIKNFILPLWNAFSFFTTYANIDKFTYNPQKDISEYSQDIVNPLDEWILSELNTLIKNVDDALAQYTIAQAIGHLSQFIDLLNNWYIRRSRRRFWKSENDVDKMQGYQTLYRVLLNFVTLAAPIIPFITEYLYQHLKTQTMPLSVHLCDYPVPSSVSNKELEYKMHIVRAAVTLGRGIRNIHQIKNRQPLLACYFVSKDDKERHTLQEMQEIIAEELNVKTIGIRENEEEFVSYSAKPNYPKLGTLFGKNMKAVSAFIASLSSRELKSLVDGDTLSIDIAGISHELVLDDIILKRHEKEGLKVLNEGTLTAALDVMVTKELEQEGIARDVVRAVQNLRKERGFFVSDRITLELFVPPQYDSIIEALESCASHIQTEVLAETYVVHKKDASSTSSKETSSVKSNSGTSSTSNNNGSATSVLHRVDIQGIPMGVLLS